ncbi:peptide/nickel transport system permease protein [Halarchaeum rubridurum]|uniref:Peptide ABC transporter permease n=1 Tax=Halarchaeum rubridurum TaxID=489911 RepID=A0A830G2S9_9EURY|nr:ABC transporter permease [Halarchaeum rubridurum]MBP1955398.1 peptide/nickel transport system permease protein [Halarchaeum rubridurum]GGM72098.1 peptide ABC transporter permease [Halarchaeum rubridurum]
MTRFALRYLLRRLVVAYATLLVVMTLLFVLLRAMPGSFVSAMTTPGMTTAQTARLEAAWGVHDPLWMQYLRFLLNYQTGNFGWSPTMHAPVAAVLARRLPRTLVLFGAAFLACYAVGPLVGMVLGWYRDARGGTLALALSLFVYATPVFWVAWLLVWLLDHRLGWLPSAHMVTQFPAFDVAPLPVALDFLRHLALPLLSVAAVGWVGATLLVRPAMRDAARSDYVDLARAKGLRERTVLFKHAGRNALLPVTTSAALALAFLVDGAVVTETVFSWPGMGRLIVTAVLDRDYPLAQAAFFLVAVVVVVARLGLDVAYTYLDPRLSFGGRER